MTRTATSSPIAEVLREVLESPNVYDSNGESANVVDVIHRHARMTEAAGEKIGAGLELMAGAIRELASAIRERKV